MDADKEATVEEVPRQELEAGFLTVEEFKLVIDFLVQLRDAGKLAILPTKQTWLALALDEDDFRLKLRDLVPEAKANVQNVTEDLRQFLGALIRLDESAPDFLVETFRRGGKRSGEEVDVLKSKVKEKLAVAAEGLVTNMMKSRFQRLISSTDACMEEIDYELVSSRTAKSSGTEVNEPFLRVSLRYAPAKQDPFSLIFGPGIGRSASECFTLEFDELDIDFAVARLLEAKVAIRRLREAKKESIGTAKNERT